MFFSWSPQTSTHVCLITDFCSGGELFALLDKQPMKFFKEDSARYLNFCLLISLSPKTIFASLFFVIRKYESSIWLSYSLDLCFCWNLLSSVLLFRDYGSFFFNLCFPLGWGMVVYTFSLAMTIFCHSWYLTLFSIVMDPMWSRIYLCTIWKLNICLNLNHWDKKCISSSHPIYS